MRASVKWLKDYVDFEESPEALADRLTMAGVPVAAIEYLGKDIENVVTGKIVDIQPHANADKLLICRVDTGKEMLTIVTGAANIRYGHVVPVALIGAKLPSGMKIKESKLRGVASYGMLCSAGELNIDSKLLPPEAREGIYILPENTPLGVDIKTVLGLDDVVLEFELTANRADCFSVLGLARETAVVTNGSCTKPMLHLREEGAGKTAELVNISVQEPSLCPRFAGRVLTDVKVGPSPEWIKQRLQAAGMRSINNVVDVTNFVMLELGQPMHAYDYHLLGKHSLIVRKAQAGERLTTLDGVKRDLTPDMLVIADAVQPVGIAGVMGGLATEVTVNTHTVLLESAAFYGASVRRTSRSLGLRSEASGRFERGVDVANVMKALDRAAGLLEEMGACKVCPGIADAYPGIALPRQISFTPDEVNRYLGTSLEKQAMLTILQRLEFDVSANSQAKILVTVPSWRGDVACTADICEEIARIFGYHNIPAKTPVGAMVQGGQSVTQDVVDQVKTVLAGSGFAEIITYSFTHPATIRKLNLSDQDPLAAAIEIVNPITDDFPVLRTSLWGGLLETIGRNLARSNEDMRFFEVGAVFRSEQLPLSALPQEPLMLCGAMLGQRYAAAWNTARDSVDFYDAKGAVEVLLEALGITQYQVVSGTHCALHPGKTARFMAGDTVLATVGEVHPQVLEAFGVNRKVYLFEVAMDTLIQHMSRVGRYSPLPKFPAIHRDLALVLAESITADAVKQAISDSAGPLLYDVSLFDVYAGGQVPDGFRSLAFSLYFRSPERTLTDSEVDACQEKIVRHVAEKLQAKLR